MNETQFFIILNLIKGIDYDSASEDIRRSIDALRTEVTEYAWENFPGACCA